MGLLDRWTKREEKKKLTVEKPVVSDAEKTDKPVKAVKAAVSKTKTLKTEETTKKAVVASETKTIAATKNSVTADRILVRPLVTEKSAIAQSQNKYGFVVSRSATKNAVKKAISEAYGVMPEKINLINASGKWVRFGQSFGRRSDFKKAIITLPAGKSITIHEGV